MAICNGYERLGLLSMDERMRRLDLALQQLPEDERLMIEDLAENLVKVIKAENRRLGMKEVPFSRWNAIEAIAAIGISLAKI